jgi:prepilin signal peptidase PulO-like enzyme (type II secretory pathway)
METLYTILASFDIFQILINLFPQIYVPLEHAFELIFGMLYKSAREIVTAHPGLVSGILIFTGTYWIFSVILNRRKEKVVAGNPKV